MSLLDEFEKDKEKEPSLLTQFEQQAKPSLIQEFEAFSTSSPEYQQKVQQGLGQVKQLGLEEQPLDPHPIEDPVNLALMTAVPLSMGYSAPASLIAKSPALATLAEYGSTAATGAALGGGWIQAQNLLNEGKPASLQDTAIGATVGAILPTGLKAGGEVISHYGPQVAQSFSSIIKGLAKDRGTSPQQVNKELQQMVKAGEATNRGEALDKIMQQAAPENLANPLVETPQAALSGPEKFAQDIGYSPSGLQVNEQFSIMNLGIGITEDAGKVYTRTMRTETIKGVTEKVKNVLQGLDDPLDKTLPEAKQTMLQVSDMIEKGQVTIPGLDPILERLGIDKMEYLKFQAEEFKRAGSGAGRYLNQLSQMSKEFKKAYQGTEAEGLFDELAKKADAHPWLNKISSLFKNTVNAVRGSVVAQWATAARNDITQKTYGGIEIFDTMLQGVLRGDVKGAFKEGAVQSRIMGRGIADQVADVFTLGHYMKGKEASKFVEILKKYPLEDIKLNSSAVHEVASVNKYLKTINFLNNWQELHNRRIGFEMRLARNIARLGYDPFKYDIKMIPEKEMNNALKDAVDFGLDMSFANEAKNEVSKSVVNWFRQVPPLQLINYFPRFNFANAWQYIYEFTPLGFTQFLSKPTRMAVANGNTKALSRAIIGTALTAGGYAIRSSEYAGPKWYQVKVGPGENDVVDTRPYAPFNVYLFLGELIHNPRNITLADFALYASGMSRVQGTGLVLIDLLRQRPRSQQGLNLIKDFAGTFFGGLSVPARTPKDIIGGIQQHLNPNQPASEAIYRDTDQNLLFGPFLSNIPGMGTLQDKGIIDAGMEPLYSPFGGGQPTEPKSPILKQFSGVNLREMTSWEQEVARMNLDFRSIYPATGVPKADNKIQQYMGSIMPIMGDPTYQTVELEKMTMTPELYKTLPDAGKRLFAREYFKELRARAKALLTDPQSPLYDPTLATQIKIKAINQDEAELLGIDKNELYKYLNRQWK